SARSAAFGRASRAARITTSPCARPSKRPRSASAIFRMCSIIGARSRARRRCGWRKNLTPSARRAVADYLARTGRAASVEPSALKVFQRVRYSVPSPEPPVSILIPTRDRVDLVERCISGILERTDYRNLEILIVDNGSQEEDSLRYLVEIGRMPRVRVLRHDAAFN